MPKMGDVYTGGIWVWLHCWTCKTAVFTHRYENEEYPLIVANLWESYHIELFPGHDMSKRLHYAP